MFEYLSLIMNFSGKNIKLISLRLIKHSGTPDYVGRGVIIGLFVAFAVPYSMQMLVAFPLAVFCHGNRFAALLSTWITNPLTIPLIYPVQCLVGSYLIGRPLSLIVIRQLMSDMIASPSLKVLMNFGEDLLFSFFAGGILFGALAAALGYPLTIIVVRKYRERRSEQKVKYFESSRCLGKSI